MTGHPARTKGTADLLRIYLQDHYAGASAGARLARRAADAYRSTERAGLLDNLAADIEADRQSLRSLMGRLDVSADPLKAAAAVVGERLGRLKLNGSVLRRSPLSSVVEFEGLLLGITGKAAGWRSLRRVAETDGRLDGEHLDQLIERAETQRDAVERLRMAAVHSALTEPD